MSTNAAATALIIQTLTRSAAGESGIVRVLPFGHNWHKNMQVVILLLILSPLFFSATAPIFFRSRPRGAGNSTTWPKPL
jgi:hypothetical protein